MRSASFLALPLAGVGLVDLEEEIGELFFLDFLFFLDGVTFLFFDLEVVDEEEEEEEEEGERVESDGS